MCVYFWLCLISVKTAKPIWPNIFVRTYTIVIDDQSWKMRKHYLVKFHKIHRKSGFTGADNFDLIVNPFLFLIFLMDAYCLPMQRRVIIILFRLIYCLLNLSASADCCSVYANKTLQIAVQFMQTKLCRLLFSLCKQNPAWSLNTILDIQIKIILVCR